MARPAAKDLTDRELEVMHVFWRHGEQTAAEARDRLAGAGPDLTYPTVANLVRILHEKGFLEAANAERPFRYRPCRSYEDVSGRLLAYARGYTGPPNLHTWAPLYVFILAFFAALEAGALVLIMPLRDPRRAART